MIIRTEHNRENPYVQIHKKMLEDPELSWAAKGLLTYLLSRHDNWKVSVEHLAKIYIGEARGNGEKGLRTIIKELIQAGYCEYKQIKDEHGLYQEGEYIIREMKKSLPNSFEGNAVKRDSVKAGLIKNDVKENDLKKKETTPPLTPPLGEGSADADPIESFSAPPIKPKIKEKPKIDEKPRYGAVVRLSEAEHTKLCQDHGSALVAVIIEEMNDYCLAHGKKYKDYAAAIRNWIGKRKKTKLDPNKRTFAPSSTIEGSLECLKRAKVGAI